MYLYIDLKFTLSFICMIAILKGSPFLIFNLISQLQFLVKINKNMIKVSLNETFIMLLFAPVQSASVE